MSQNQIQLTESLALGGRWGWVGVGGGGVAGLVMPNGMMFFYSIQRIIDIVNNNTHPCSFIFFFLCPEGRRGNL